jgi:hypothetical protein
MLAVGSLFITLPAEATSPSPVAPWRWKYPFLCLDNHTSMPMQIATREWDRAADLRLQYESCGAFRNDQRIDIHQVWNYNRTDVCSYPFRVVDHNYIQRQIIYLNRASTSCWNSTVRRNHFTSKAIGSALGLLEFTGYSPNHVSVMRRGSHDSVSYAQDGDRLTFDWYNNL